MRDDRVLIIDDDAETAAALGAALADAGLAAESVDETFAAIDKLRAWSYRAVILDPAIRHRLNGYAVLNLLELEEIQHRVAIETVADGRIEDDGAIAPGAQFVDGRERLVDRLRGEAGVGQRGAAGGRGLGVAVDDQNAIVTHAKAPRRRADGASSRAARRWRTASGEKPSAAARRDWRCRSPRRGRWRKSPRPRTPRRCADRRRGRPRRAARDRARRHPDERPRSSAAPPRPWPRSAP